MMRQTTTSHTGRAFYKQAIFFMLTAVFCIGTAYAEVCPQKVVNYFSPDAPYSLNQVTLRKASLPPDERLPSLHDYLECHYTNVNDDKLILDSSTLWNGDFYSDSIGMLIPSPYFDIIPNLSTLELAQSWSEEDGQLKCTPGSGVLCDFSITNALGASAPHSNSASCDVNRKLNGSSVPGDFFKYINFRESGCPGTLPDFLNGNSPQL